MEIIQNKSLENTIFVGELSLDGKVQKVNGILPICIECRKNNIKRIVVPKENEKEAAIIEDVEVIGVKDLQEAIMYLNGNLKIEKVVTNTIELFKNNIEYDIDFSEVKGNESIKRVIEIMASGSHNLLMVGPPGSGKTMIAKRIPTILPDLNFEEALEITKIHSIAGSLKNESIITKRPFRNPHHTITNMGLIGGGKIPKPRRNKFSTLRSIIFR